jgi:hypothetical protein
MREMMWEKSMYLIRGNLSKSVLPALAAWVGFMCALTMFVQTAVQAAPATTAPACPSDDTGLILPSGFCATIFADDIGHAHHRVVATNGVVYVNTWSGVYYGNDTPHAGGFLVALKEGSGAGKADVEQSPAP